MEENHLPADRHGGTVTIAPEVVATIARLAALAQDGVERMVPRQPPRGRGRSATEEGVRIVVEGDQVSVDLFLVCRRDVNMRSVGQAVQSAVRRAVEEMVGMQVRQVDVHIEEVAIEKPSADGNAAGQGGKAA